MPINNQGLSALSGLALFMATIVFAYLNSTTDSFFWSMVYVGGVIVCALASGSKLAVGVGISNRFSHVMDSIASIVPWVAIAGAGLQAIRYNQDGLSGFMAGFSILTIVFLIQFGVADALSAWFGGKYHKISEGFAETSARMAAANEALRTKQQH